MAEKMLKPGWKVWRFDQIAENIGERANPTPDDSELYVGLEHMEANSLRVRSWGSKTDLIGQKLKMRKGDILFARRNAYLKRVAIAPHDGLFSAHGMVLRAKPGAVLPEFLPFFMQSDLFMDRAIQISVGSLSPTINWKTLAAQEFMLPPTDEQKRSARLLSALEDQIEAIHVASTAATKLRKSVALDAFSSVDSLKFKMGAVAEIRNGTTPRRARDEYWKGSIPWLPTGKVNDRIIIAADEFISEKALKECPLTLIPSSSTLIAMIGEGQTRGRAAMLAIDACINQNFGAVIPGNTLDPWYLFYLLESNYEALRHWSQGTNQHALSCGLLKEFPIPVPALDRQREIVESIKEVEANERQLEERFKKAVEMRRVGHQAALSAG